MADGRRVPIELLTPGDVVRSLTVPGLRTDVPFRAQYEWLSTWGLAGATERGARINEVRLGEHDGFCPNVDRPARVFHSHAFDAIVVGDQRNCARAIDEVNAVFPDRARQRFFIMRTVALGVWSLWTCSPQ